MREKPKFTPKARNHLQFKCWSLPSVQYPVLQLNTLLLLLTVNVSGLAKPQYIRPDERRVIWGSAVPSLTRPGDKHTGSPLSQCPAVREIMSWKDGFLSDGNGEKGVVVHYWWVKVNISLQLCLSYCSLHIRSGKYFRPSITQPSERGIVVVTNLCVSYR